MPNLRHALRHRWWGLPLAAMLLGIVCLLLRDARSRTAQATSDLVNLQSAVEVEASAHGESRAVLQVILSNMQATDYMLLRVTQFVMLATLITALATLGAADIPRWVQILTIAYALYCTVGSLLTARLS
jgi:hypothetical protein